MTIKNFTTKISVEKTVGEIERILSQNGAKKILKDYDASGNINGIQFLIELKEQQIPFKLPIDLFAWISLINLAVKEKKLPQRFTNNGEQARRVGWRVIKDWIDSQMALIQTKTVTIEQVFLPYAYDISTDKTIYEKFKEQTSKFIALDSPKDSKEFEQKQEFIDS